MPKTILRAAWNFVFSPDTSAQKELPHKFERHNFVNMRSVSLLMYLNHFSCDLLNKTELLPGFTIEEYIKSIVSTYSALVRRRTQDVKTERVTSQQVNQLIDVSTFIIV